MTKKLMQELLTEVESVSEEVEVWAKAKIAELEADEKKVEAAATVVANTIPAPDKI